ncbi:MAG: HlyD family efflux transporter periplasmic adaptor subunit, partial [Clostridium sp.]|nr:HlyD family efflux transporter periplasmic adaptor subunit [Clostridium sp.]
AKKQLSEFEAFVGDGKIYASESGIVTEIGYEEGDDLLTSGNIVSYTTAEDMKISVDVSQEDIVVLTVGDVVDIVFSAYEDEMYEGVISSIKTTATSGYAATVSYEVVIDLKGDTSKLYGGMTADVTFVTEKKEDVVYVSKTAVMEEGEKKYVYIKDSNGEMVTKEVVMGIENTIYVEIVEGLKEGDIVYAASKVSRREKDKSKKDDDIESFDSQEEGMQDMMPEGMEFEIPEGGFPEGMAGQMPNFGR